MRRFLYIHVHVPRFAADEGFVRFAFAFHHFNAAIVQGKPDAVIQKPCRLLCDSQSAVHLPRTVTVLAVAEHPHHRKPLVQAQRGRFKDGAGLRGELAALMVIPALPAVILGLPENILGAAPWTGDAIRPAAHYEVFTAAVGIREIDNRFLKGDGLFDVFHAQNLSRKSLSWQVYYYHNFC